MDGRYSLTFPGQGRGSGRIALGSQPNMRGWFNQPGIHLHLQAPPPLEGVLMTMFGLPGSYNVTLSTPPTACGRPATSWVHGRPRAAHADAPLSGIKAGCSHTA
eukprot:363075-Chlamydomonas_euryale.AAC.6